MLRLCEACLHLARLCRAQSGVTAVETALLLPLLLAFIIGIEEVGRLLWTQAALQYGTEAAARCALVASCSTSSDVTTYASNHVYGLTIPSSAFTYTAAGTCGGSQVTASYSFMPLVPALVGGLSITLQANACLAPTS